MKIEEIDLLDPRRFARGEHHQMLRLLRNQNPVHWHDEPDGAGFWCITKHADVREISRQASIFSSEREGISPLDIKMQAHGMDPRGVMMMMTDPPRHTRYRKLVSNGFTPRMLNVLGEQLRPRASRIIDRAIERGGELEFVTEIAAELPLQAIAQLVGLAEEDRQLLFDWSDRLTRIEDPDFDPLDSMTAVAELTAYTRKVAADRREEPRDDVISKLVHAEIETEDGASTRLSDAEFDAFMMLLVIAGNETTRNATTLGMHALLTHPDQWEQMKANFEDEAWMRIAIDEILRFTTPALHFRRTATQDYELRDKTIRAGEQVSMWYVSANFDEEVFDRPLEFDLTRQPNDHVTFGGGGPHHCLGANLARLELVLIFQEIARRLPDIELLGPPVFMPSTFVTMASEMPVRI